MIILLYCLCCQRYLSLPLTVSFPLSLSCYGFTAVQEQMGPFNRKENHRTEFSSKRKDAQFFIVASFVTVIEETNDFSTSHF